MNQAYIIGWATAMFLRTIIPFIIEHRKDGRAWDWNYIGPAAFSVGVGLISIIPEVQGALADNGITVPETTAGAVLAGVLAAFTAQEAGARLKKSIGEAK